jgi:hypothetical protein
MLSGMFVIATGVSAETSCPSPFKVFMIASRFATDERYRQLDGSKAKRICA